MDTTDIESLTQRLQEIKEEQKSLNEQEVVVKEFIRALLEEDGLDKYESEHCTVRFQSRSKKKYNAAYEQQEADLKAAKELLDSLGDYEVVPLEASLVYAAPKTPAVPSF
jgi:hypothetical protein